jgi:hypothetical protein
VTYNEPSIKVRITPNFAQPVNGRFQTKAIGRRNITMSVTILIPASATQTGSGPAQDPGAIFKLRVVSGFQENEN